jgi:hypothetical protein
MAISHWLKFGGDKIQLDSDSNLGRYGLPTINSFRQKKCSALVQRLWNKSGK